MIVSCACGARLKIDKAKISGRKAKVRCPRCGNVLAVRHMPTETHEAPQRTASPAPSTPGPLVLVAHDSGVVRGMVCGVLTEAGFRVETASDGFETLKKARELGPDGLVLDVGLPGIYGFELCEKLKGNPDTGNIKIVLLSSVYDMRRYKRTPVSLYGADDYVEKHHIPDFLPEKLRSLMLPAEPEGAPPKTPPADGAGTAALSPQSFSLEASVFQKEECDIPPVDEGESEAVEKARRFARIIVSDIALYNQAAVVEGIRTDTFFELLEKDVQEGRELYERRIPAEIRAKKDFYQEAFDNFIAAAKRENVR